MLRDIECEPLAAACYSQQNAVNLLLCGVIISPFCSWLAASPDRRHQGTRTYLDCLRL